MKSSLQLYCLKEYGGMTNKEIAQIFGMKPNSVSKAYSRVRGRVLGDKSLSDLFEIGEMSPWGPAPMGRC